jgi:glycosyltransferase involved in cell wall biosynthesis
VSILKNVFYHRTPRREPLYASWNRAIRMARGKYLTSANADDRHSPDALELLSGALEANPDAALSYGDYAETNVPNETLRPHHAGRAVPGIEFRRDRLLVKCFVGSHRGERPPGMQDGSRRCPGESGEPRSRRTPITPCGGNSAGKHGHGSAMRRDISSGKGRASRNGGSP